LRATVAVEVAALSRQQITTLPRLGLENPPFKSGNSAKDFVRVFDLAKAVSLPSQIDAECHCGNDKHPHGNGKCCRHRPRQDQLPPS
jgi:hypothetical protein